MVCSTQCTEQQILNSVDEVRVEEKRIPISGLVKNILWF